MSRLPGDRDHAPREIAAERVVDAARLRDAAELSPSLAPQPDTDEFAVSAEGAAHARLLRELEDFVARSKAATGGSSTSFVDWLGVSRK